MYILLDLCDLDLWPFDVILTGHWMGTSNTYHTKLYLHRVSGYCVKSSAITQSLQIYWYEYNIGDPCDLIFGIGHWS